MDTCTTLQVTSNFTSEPLTPAKQWQEYQEIATLVEKVRGTSLLHQFTNSPLHHFTTHSRCGRSSRATRCAAPCPTGGTP